MGLCISLIEIAYFHRSAPKCMIDDMNRGVGIIKYSSNVHDAWLMAGDASA